MADDNLIKARFMVTRKSVTIYAKYREVSCVLRWDQNSENPERQERHIRTLIGNLDTLVAGGLQEVVIQMEMANLDREWFDLDEPPPSRGVAMSDLVCPDHPDSTMHGIIGDFYCLECDWWDVPIEGDDDE